MWIKVLLLAGVLITLVMFVRSEHGLRMQANKKLAFFVFLLVNAYAVLRPDDLSWVANRLGVGRGADLLLYLLVLAFVFVALNLYLKMRQYERQLTDLAREMAVREAEQVNRQRGLLID
jgi:small membrane protein